MTSGQTPSTDAGLEQLWRHVLDHWTDEAAHLAFLQSCQAARRLPEAAARYRGMAGDHSRREIAEKKLEAITILALSQMESERSTPPPPRRASTLVALAVVLLVGLGLLVLYLSYF